MLALSVILKEREKCSNAKKCATCYPFSYVSQS